MKNIALIGFMGAGKSTVAAAFQEKFGRTAVEMDEEIARREGKSIPDIFKEKGEDYFRERETAFLRELSGREGLVISCGGGVPLRPENVALLRKGGVVVWLAARPETILERTKGSDDRPLLRGKKDIGSISQLMDARREKYEAAADIRVWTDGKTGEEICREILGALDEAI